MRRRHIRFLLFLTGLIAATALSAQAAQEQISPLRDPARVAEHLDRLQERLVTSTGMLPRYEHEVHQLEETLRKSEYRQFHEWLRRKIVEPWRQINHAVILHLAASPPDHISPAQQTLLRRNWLEMRAINNKLRRARRLLTRLGKQNEERLRCFGELDQLRRRYVRLTVELERLDPERARLYRNWLESELQPRLEGLQARDRFVAEGVRRMERWTEDPALREMIHNIRRVTAALEQLRRRYHMD
jgi:hypothetical protein